MENEQKENAKKLAETLYAAIDSKKGVDVRIMEIGSKTVLADYFVIATGTSSTHVHALADEAEFKSDEQLGIKPNHSEGFGGGGWILMDYGSVIVHIFTSEARDFYKIEKLWTDAETIYGA